VFWGIWYVCHLGFEGVGLTFLGRTGESVINSACL